MSYWTRSQEWQLEKRDERVVAKLNEALSEFQCVVAGRFDLERIIETLEQAKAAIPSAVLEEGELESDIDYCLIRLRALLREPSK